MRLRISIRWTPFSGLLGKGSVEDVKRGFRDSHTCQNYQVGQHSIVDAATDTTRGLPAQLPISRVNSMGLRNTKREL
jgi:hypothetical protein